MQIGYAPWGRGYRWSTQTPRSADSRRSGGAHIPPYTWPWRALARHFDAGQPSWRLASLFRLESQTISVFRTYDAALFRSPNPDCMTITKGANVRKLFMGDSLMSYGR